MRSLVLCHAIVGHMPRPLYLGQTRLGADLSYLLGKLHKPEGSARLSVVRVTEISTLLQTDDYSDSDLDHAHPRRPAWGNIPLSQQYCSYFCS